jgi:threonine/homoserine/homoserine lactone efflux protein
VGEAIGQVLPLAIGVALSPVPIIAVVLMLGTPRARANGPAFIGGWIAGLSVVGAIVLVGASGASASERGAPAEWVGILELVLGALLLGLASRTWRSRPRAGEPAELPNWMRTLDRYTPERATAMGVALTVVNPKNLLLAIAAAAAIAQTGVGTGQQAGALAIFVLIATLGPGIPVGIYFAMPERAPRLLAELKDWMAAHNAAIMAVLCVIIAAKLIGDGVSGLSG